MVSETKSWFFEKIDKVDKPFTGLVMKKKKKKREQAGPDQ